MPLIQASLSCARLLKPRLSWKATRYLDQTTQQKITVVKHGCLISCKCTNGNPIDTCICTVLPSLSCAQCESQLRTRATDYAVSKRERNGTTPSKAHRIIWLDALSLAVVEVELLEAEQIHGLAKRVCEETRKRAPREQVT